MTAPQLLVSVRSAAEAIAALEGGADLIDIKEPNAGSLGRASSTTMGAILDAIAGRRPVSAALGEWATEFPSHVLPEGLCWVKWGLAGVSDPREVAKVRHATRVPPVLVAYADWQRANCFPPSRLVELAIEHSFPVLLVDTFHKDGTTLFDWVQVETLAGWVQRLRTHHIAVALAGSLREGHFPVLRSMQATWLAVRGAACVQQQRTATIDSDRVRMLKYRLAES